MTRRGASFVGPPPQTELEFPLGGPLGGESPPRTTRLSSGHQRRWSRPMGDDQTAVLGGDPPRGLSLPVLWRRACRARLIPIGRNRMVFGRRWREKSKPTTTAHPCLL